MYNFSVVGAVSRAEIFNMRLFRLSGPRDLWRFIKFKVEITQVSFVSRKREEKVFGKQVFETFFSMLQPGVTFRDTA